MSSNPADASKVLAYLGVGSNLGDRESLIRDAINAVDALPDTEVILTSQLYETEPKYVIDQPRFLNGAFSIETTLSPRRLLAGLLGIESELGRVRVQKNGPRAIDLDILIYGDLIIDQSRLRVPHPGIPDRAFVLVPLAEIAADDVHPLLETSFSELLLTCPGRDEVVVWAPNSVIGNGPVDTPDSDQDG